jgi:aryl-alcohol dehydrogenase-like predicted oxidoreductase
MRQRRLGRSGALVSELCLGCMTFGREADEPASRAIVDRFLDAGGTFIDTADVYTRGVSEEITGRALAGRRDDVVLATKVRFAMGERANDVGVSRRHIIAACDASLRRLGTDWIDLYQVHMWDAMTPLEETFGTLTDLVRAGKVRYVGVSNFAGWQLLKAELVARERGFEPIVTLQPQYSLVERHLEYEIVPAALDRGIGLIPWGPLGAGFLTGKYRRESGPQAGTRVADSEPEHVEHWSRRGASEQTWAVVDAVREIASAVGRTPSQVALNWLLQQPGVVAPIVGARTVEQLEDNLGATGWTLDPEHVARLDDVSAPPPLHPYDMIAGGQR